jgi:hypothetical protein
MKELTREQAKEQFRLLVAKYGLQWDSKVPAEAYEQMNRVNRVLTTADRREALGLRN